MSWKLRAPGNRLSSWSRTPVAMAGDGVKRRPRPRRGRRRSGNGLRDGQGHGERAGVTILNGKLTGNRPRSRTVAEDDVEHSAEPALAGIPIAARRPLPPFFGILLSPIIAAAMALSSVSVISNALRLRTQRL